MLEILRSLRSPRLEQRDDTGSPDVAFPNDLFLQLQTSILEITEADKYLVTDALLVKSMSKFMDIYFYSLRNFTY